MTQRHNLEFIEKVNQFADEWREPTIDEDVDETYRIRRVRCFAKLNGWSCTDSWDLWSYSARVFGLRQLAGQRWLPRLLSPTIWDDNPTWFYRQLDCPLWFRRDQEPVAIMSVLYEDDDRIARVREVADFYGLEVVEPPLKRSGDWWFPGWPYCFVIVRQGTPIQWLPEQMADVNEA